MRVELLSTKQDETIDTRSSRRRITIHAVIKRPILHQTRELHRRRTRHDGTDFHILPRLDIRIKRRRRIERIERARRIRKRQIRTTRRKPIQLARKAATNSHRSRIGRYVVEGGAATTDLDENIRSRHDSSPYEASSRD